MPRGRVPTKPVRLHLDVAELAEQLAGVFKKSVPDFTSDLLRPILLQKKQEAAQMLSENGHAKKSRKPADD